MLRNMTLFAIITTAILSIATVVFAAGDMGGPAEKQPLNVHAIIMFLVFVTVTLGITYWAAQRTKTAKDFYAGRDYRVSEWFSHCWRLHVRRFLFRNCGISLQYGL